MDTDNKADIEQRVLFVPPTAKDAEVTGALLNSMGIACNVFRNIADLMAAIDAGAGVLLLTEEILTSPTIVPVVAWLNAQPPWSDLPVVILMHGSMQSAVALRTLQSLRNVTLLERPAPSRSVISAVQAAIRGRQRQYQMRDQIAEIQAGEAERQQLLESEQAARREAERTSRMKDEFLATLSHELRTPLNAIVGWVQLLQRGKGDPEMVSEGLEAIDRNVRAQTQLIEDLLDMSRIISGKVRLDVQPFDVEDAITTAIESVKPAAEAKGIRLERVMEAESLVVNGDAGRLRQVLWNLLTNAVKFTPKGGLIQVLTRRMNSQVEIRVKDSGQGIQPEFLPRLFERFSQADASTTRKHGGLGLGLSIVKNLVEMHGGTVGAESAGVGEGAVFIVHLPVRAVGINEARLGPARGKSATPPGSAFVLPHLAGIKVLVVDDEPDAREVIRRLLIECQAVPTLAASAADAEEILSRMKPDVILSDIGMPDRDGYSFMREVRRRGIQVPAVAVTAFARPEDRMRSLQAGFQMYLAKPVEPAELLGAITRLTRVGGGTV